MKNILFIITLIVVLSSCKTYDEVYSDRPTYVTPNKDTLFVVEDLYQLFDSIWNQPENISERPVLIKVDCVDKFYTKTK